jgi:hypothetical protein
MSRFVCSYRFKCGAELAWVSTFLFVSGHLKLTDWVSVSLFEHFVGPMPPVCF